MFLYICTLGLSLIFAILYNVVKYNKKHVLRLLLGILILMLLLLSILRKNTVGGDLINYIPLYDTIAKSSFGEALAIPKYGIIYLFYNKILTLLSPNEFTFMLGTSLVNLLPVFWLIIKYSKIPLLSIFLYVSIGYYTNTFNSVRSSMAIAITICCIPYILERKFYSFLFLYILALCVHLSSFPFILTYWVVNLKLSFKRIISLIVFSYLLSESVSNWIIGYLYLYDPVYDKFESTTGGYSYFFMLFFIFISGYIIYNQNNDKNISKENDLFLRVMLIATCIQPFAFHFMLINRIVLFFSVYIIIFIPNFILYIRPTKIRILGHFIVYVFFVLFFIKIIMGINPEYNSNGQMTIPYLFYWE